MIRAALFITKMQKQPKWPLIRMRKCGAVMQYNATPLQNTKYRYNSNMEEFEKNYVV